jgi:His-Xaa-Ser system radical SAM maturase HxsB
MRTRHRRLAGFTGLHIFVVTLRCEHSCPYCQVSRQSADRSLFDMSESTAREALAMVFRSPSPNVKIEFQGGEPLLNLPVIRYVIEEAHRMNDAHGKNLAFVVATNLALLDDEAISLARENDLYFSTSLDGPADLHNGNRPRPGGDSHKRAVEGIRRIREELGADRVSALMTTTLESLSRAREIVDCYVDEGLNDIFLRPISPYGFAVRGRSYDAYETARWLDFYTEGLDYIIELNRGGTHISERFASIILRKMLTNDDPGYVDLTSPAGIGLGCLVYNYDGAVYASDEARMLAEMGDTTFRLGQLGRDSYEAMMLSDALLDPLEASFALSVPMCCDCAFEPYCGADPVFHHATAGDAVGRKPTSAFCQRNLGVFERLVQRYDRDRATREIFRRWAGR